MTAPDRVDPDRQAKVLKALRQRSITLAGMYEVMLQTLQLSVHEDSSLARVSAICHCGRELMNGLPTVLSGVDIPRPKPNSSALKDSLPSLLSDVDLDLDQDLIPVPREVAATLSTLIKTVAKEQGRNRQLASIAITGEMDDEHPVIRQWVEAQKFFMQWTHLDRSRVSDRTVPSDEVIREHLLVVEELILARTAAFFDAVASVKDLLMIANATDEDD